MKEVIYEPLTVVLPESTLKELSTVYNRLQKYGVFPLKVSNEFWKSDVVELAVHHYCSNCLPD